MTREPTEPPTIAELIALFRKLEQVLGLLPENPPPELVFRYADEAQRLVELMRATFEHPAVLTTTTEAEIDELHAAMSEASLVLHRRFPQLPPRAS